MHLACQLRPSLPKLAWYAVVETARSTCRVLHGPWVETSGNAFIEGVWDGDFVSAGFDLTACIYGSGAVVRDGSITFVSSLATTDYLYWWMSGDRNRVEVSNSLPLLLAALGDELDPDVTDYHLVNESITLGIDRYQRRIPTRDKGPVSRLMHRNLHVGPDGIAEIDKPSDPRFERFDAYLNFVDEAYARIAANARDTNRKRPMAIFSTQSRGYDTTAVNAIAAKYGIEKVFTVTKGKAKGYYANSDRGMEPDDDGSEICRLLSLNCIPINRRAVESDGADEYLIYATMHESSDLNFHEIAAHVEAPTILLTGCLGEIWYTEDYYRYHPDDVDSSLVRGDLGTHALTEVRLQAGFVQVAVPYIGARSRDDIYRITLSPEMEPWRLKKAYDRPIPRRIAEQAGVPRNLFGQTKLASPFELPAPILPVGTQLRRDYLDFLIANRILTRWKCALLDGVRRWNAVVTTMSPKHNRWIYYLQRALSKGLGRRFEFAALWQQLNGRIFCYCVNRRVQEYSVIFHSPTEVSEGIENVSV